MENSDFCFMFLSKGGICKKGAKITIIESELSSVDCWNYFDIICVRNCNFGIITIKNF